MREREAELRNQEIRALKLKVTWETIDYLQETVRAVEKASDVE